MNISEQNEALQNVKSVQEVSKRSAGQGERRHGKTDQRYWQDAIFKPTYTKDGQRITVEEWAVKVQHLGRRETFPLHTANRTAAAAKAKDIHTMLVGMGWEPTLAKFKPEMQRKALTTVGDFLCELREGHWSGKPKTFEDYCQKFRTMLSQIFNIKGGNQRFDYVNGGPERLGCRDRHHQARGRDTRAGEQVAHRLREAGRDEPGEIAAGANLLQQHPFWHGKSLFAPGLLAHLGANKPAKSPFEGVPFYPRESMRYRSEINVEALVQDALRELPEQQLKNLPAGRQTAGLRRNEIDKLEWPAFRWDAGLVRIEATEHFTPKTEDSGGDVPIDKELVAMFRGWHAKAAGAFVIESDTAPRIGERYTHYRAHRHFDALTAWLRAKGVKALKPLHELRKEFGSQLLREIRHLRGEPDVAPRGHCDYQRAPLGHERTRDGGHGAFAAGERPCSTGREHREPFSRRRHEVADVGMR